MAFCGKPPKCMQKFSIWLQYCASSNNSDRIVSYRDLHAILRYSLRWESETTEWSPTWSSVVVYSVGQKSVAVWIIHVFFRYDGESRVSVKYSLATLWMDEKRPLWWHTILGRSISWIWKSTCYDIPALTKDFGRTGIFPIWLCKIYDWHWNQLVKHYLRWWHILGRSISWIWNSTCYDIPALTKDFGRTGTFPIWRCRIYDW
jgi:hypothetical protein